MRYLDKLNLDLIRQHVEQTNSLWGIGRDVEERLLGMLQHIDSQTENFFLSGIVDENLKLKASLKRYYFDIKLRGQAFRCVGLGAVFTEPAARNKGLAQSLIQKVLTESQSEFDCDFAMLYSDIAPEFYYKFGFKDLPARVGTSAVAEFLPTQLKFSEVEIDDRTKLLNLFDHFTKPAEFHAHRNSKSWSFFREINNLGKDYFIVNDVGAVGYATMSVNRNQKTLWLDELFVQNSLIKSTWNALLKFSHDHGLCQIRGWENSLIKLPFEIFEPRLRAIPMVARLTGNLIADDGMFKAFYFSAADHF